MGRTSMPPIGLLRTPLKEASAATMIASVTLPATSSSTMAASKRYAPVR